MGRYKAVRAFAMAAATLVSSAGFAQGKGEFTIPGTQSTIKIYGFARVDTMYDFAGRADYENADWATFLPAVPADNQNLARRPQFYMTARASRFGIESVTPASKRFGNLNVKIEGDFQGTNSFQTESYTNSVLFRLRHAYGSFAGLLVGQTWSTFLDLGAYPDVVDFNGPGTIALVRAPQIRYAYSWKTGAAKGLSIAVAAEYSRGSQFAGNAGTAASPSSAAARFQTMPDFHLNITYAWRWGHISARGVTLMYNWSNPGAGGTSTDPAYSAFGGGAALSGSFKFFGDSLVWQFAGGNGIGRYMLNSAGTRGLDTPGSVQGGAVWDAVKKQINLVPSIGYHLGFTHVWPKGFRSSVVWAQTFNLNPDPSVGYSKAMVSIANLAVPLPIANTHQLFINTFWSFLPNASAGLEYSYGKWTSYTQRNENDGLTPTTTVSTAGSYQTGTQHRLTLLFTYNFY